MTFFIADHSRWPAWLVYGVSLLGAIHAAGRGGAAIRPIARAFLAFVGLNLILNLLLVDGWKGPRIAYVDIFAYPLYCLFAAYAAAIAIRSPPVVAFWQRRTANLRAVPWLRQGTVHALAVSAVPWLVLIDYAPPPLARPLVRNLNPFIWPPSQTPVTRVLRGGWTAAGVDVRGRVASVAGSDFAPVTIPRHSSISTITTAWVYSPLATIIACTDRGISASTLLELNQFSSPFFHLVNARLLNAPDTQDLRSYETQSIVNDRIMALLGTRYLLSDKVLPERAPGLTHSLVEGRDLYVYSVPAANMVGYSVTEVRRTADARDAIT